MVRISNYLFGPNVRLPFKELFVCSSLYGNEFIRQYQKLPIITPEIFKYKNEGWARAVKEWTSLSQAQKDLYEILTFDDTSSSLYLWILDNLKNPETYTEYEAPAFVFPFSSEYEEDNGVKYIKLFFQDLLPSIPNFDNFNFTIILKKAGYDPEYNQECFLNTIPFNVDIEKVGVMYKIRQDLMLDFAITPGTSYHYQIFHYNYLLNQSVYSNISITTTPA